MVALAAVVIGFLAVRFIAYVLRFEDGLDLEVWRWF